MSTEVSKKQSTHKYFTRSKKRTISESYKAISESDESSSSSSDDEDEEEEINFDMRTYRQFLTSLFPSKYMAEKTKMTPSSKNKIISNVKPKKNGKTQASAVQTQASAVQTPASAQASAEPVQYNIMFTMIDNKHNDEYYGDDYDEDDDDDYYMDESETSDESEEDETSEEEESSEEEVVVKNKKSGKKEKKNVKINEKVDEKVDDKDNIADVADETDETDTKEEIKMLTEGFSKSAKNDPIIRQYIRHMKMLTLSELRAKSFVKKNKLLKNIYKLRELLEEKYSVSDVRYFKDNMTPEEQLAVLEQLEKIKNYSSIDKPYRLALLESDIPLAIKSCAFKKISSLKTMEPGANEYHKLKNWVDTFMQIPFNKYKGLPVTMADGIDKCHEFMESAKKTLDDAVYGLNDAKLQIMQMIGQWIVNPTAIGTAIAIKGPPGTGKTSIVKEGISKILNRDFAFIALGGATDSCFLEGHSYTYEGSTWGKIVDILIACKSMNPVIYFDELDKVSDTPKGEEIIGILTHLTDSTQNNKFHDKYFTEIEFDLSRCLFIFSYNDESKINPILKDRMYRIMTKGYDQPQKTIIATNYLLPKIHDMVKFNKEDIVIPEDVLHYIITHHTDKEDGVRNLKRCLEIIHTKLNLYRLMKPDTNLFEKDLSLKVEFPLVVTIAIIDKLIKKENDSGAWSGMYN
jgi:ATP-dependent Lon protease